MSESGSLSDTIRWQISGIHDNTAPTIHVLWEKYNSLIEDATFSSVRDYVSALEIFANRYLPWIVFYIKSNPTGYSLSASAEDSPIAESSLELLQEWLSTGIATAIKTKLKIIAMQYDYKTWVYNDSMIHKIWDNRNSSLIFFDINEFKKINDTLGYPQWDEILKNFAAILKSEKFILGDATVIRNGWDEFLVIINNATIERIRAYIRKINDLFGKIPGSYGTSSGYYLRTEGSGAMHFHKAYTLADKEMKLRKWRNWKIYRLVEWIKWLPEEDKIAAIRKIMEWLTWEQISWLLKNDDTNKS